MKLHHDIDLDYLDLIFDVSFPMRLGYKSREKTTIMINVKLMQFAFTRHFNEMLIGIKIDYDIGHLM